MQFDQPAPTVGAGVLPVPEALAEILPNGGLPRGGVVTLGGDGMTSLLFGLLCRPGTSWSAVVGMPELGLLAAAEIGVDLSRVVLVPDPGPEVLQVLSVLSDGVEVIVAAAPGGPLGSAARLRVLTARLRQRGAVLLVAGRWPGADLVLTARQSGWAGIGAGHGRLHDRVLDIEVGGRGAAGRGRRGAVLLAGSGAGAVGILRGPSPESGALADVAADAV